MAATASDLYTLNHPPQRSHGSLERVINEIPPNNPLLSSVPNHQSEPERHDIFTSSATTLRPEYISTVLSDESNNPNRQHTETSKVNHHKFTSEAASRGAHSRAQASTDQLSSPDAMQTGLTSQPIFATNIGDMKPSMNGETSGAAADFALDEDAPHEEDDGGTENETSFMTLPISMADVYPDGTIYSNIQPHSWSHPQPSNSGSQEKPVIPPSTSQSGRKRKRNSANSGQSTTNPTRSQSNRPRQAPRVKTPEQLAAEALIEQQNPHASKNELRSLKLRALHAVRIAEREVNMPEAEKLRRLRLREYVRQKRAEERSLKNLMKQSDQGGQTNHIYENQSVAVSNPITSSDAQSTYQGHSRPPTQSTTHVTKIRDLVHSPPHEEAVKVDKTSHPALTHSDQCHQPISLSSSAPSNLLSSPDKKKSTGKESKSEQKLPRKKYTPRTRVSVASLEAEIKRQNPNASPAELKSIKLRALHADRIAEREQDMSEKEKTRRAKLREYMRRRRDEERAEKSHETIEPRTPLDINVGSESALGFRKSLDSGADNQSTLLSNDCSIPGSVALRPGPDGMSADDRLAAYSMMELNHSYQHQLSQSHHPQPPSNLNAHPLFHMQITQPSVGVQTIYDCSMHSPYPMAESWAHIPPPDSNIEAAEDPQKALHDAIQDAIYMEPHPHSQIGIPGQHHPHYPPTEESPVIDQYARMEQEQIGVAEDEVVGIERARQLAMIAAAAAEVGHS